MSAPQYANQVTGSLFNSGGYNNEAIRYKCNKVLATSGDLTDAVNTYTTLYNIYQTYPHSTEVNTILGPTDTDTCLGNNCPHNNINLKKSSGSMTVMAYTPGLNSNDNKLLVSDLAVYLDDCGARIRDYDNDETKNPKSYINTKNYATILHDVSYASLVTTRNDLDNKMNEILANNKNTVLSEKQSELDASVYSTLLWTVMITSLIYYVFTKI